jgi:undecaprenyl diphosphate synthase
MIQSGGTKLTSEEPFRGQTSQAHTDVTEKNGLIAPQLDPSRMPEHVAIIMDGNGRWARRRGLPRVEGHAKGTDAVRETVEECARLGIHQLTLYCLSSENWKRPPEELEFLMTLFRHYLLAERPRIMEQNLRFSMIGRREGLPADVLAEVDKTVDLSRDNTGMMLCLAVNYGSRGELIDAFKTLAQQVQKGELSPDQINESTISGALYTSGMPDPDLLIRTAGEMRVSNYLLWQISYAEIWVTQKCWPDFDRATLHQSFADYASRERRFGGLPNPMAGVRPGNTDSCATTNPSPPSKPTNQGANPA